MPPVAEFSGVFPQCSVRDLYIEHTSSVSGGPEAFMRYGYVLWDTGLLSLTWLWLIRPRCFFTKCVYQSRFPPVTGLVMVVCNPVTYLPFLFALFPDVQRYIYHLLHPRYAFSAPIYLPAIRVMAFPRLGRLCTSPRRFCGLSSLRTIRPSMFAPCGSFPASGLTTS